MITLPLLIDFLAFVWVPLLLDTVYPTLRWNKRIYMNLVRTDGVQYLPSSNWARIMYSCCSADSKSTVSSINSNNVIVPSIDFWRKSERRDSVIIPLQEIDIKNWIPVEVPGNAAGAELNVCCVLGIAITYQPILREENNIGFRRETIGMTEQRRTVLLNYLGVLSLQGTSYKQTKINRNDNCIISCWLFLSIYYWILTSSVAFFATNRLVIWSRSGIFSFNTRYWEENINDWYWWLMNAF